jgi:hypothetical protein
MFSLRRLALVLFVLPLLALALVAAMSAVAQTPPKDPLLGELQRSPSKGKPGQIPRAKRQANKKGATKKGKSRILGKKSPKGSAPKGRGPNELNWDGWPSPNIPQVGRIWAEEKAGQGFRPYCSGTVVSRTLVLTAGHCITHSAKVNGLDSYVNRILFVPGQSWNDPNSANTADIKAPYGVWEANNWWALDSYRRGPGPDWGLIEIKKREGKAIGDVVGSWRIQTGISFSPGARLWITGYPITGYWSEKRGYVGRGQYACDATWDGTYATARLGQGGTELWAKCPMNGGASGGPWLVKLNSGEWVIGGVNNWCHDLVKWDDTNTYCTPVSTFLVSLVFDARFIDFWNVVQPQLRVS